MNKIIIFSHESDIDGAGCVILAKLAFLEIEYVLAPNNEKLELVFREYIENKRLDNYDSIFVTDLALFDPSLTMVANSNLKDKVLVFDHHKMAIEKKLNRYSFTKIIEEDAKGKRCGTDLFYEYLCDNNYLNSTKCIEQFVELTKLEDTWQWKKAGEFGIKAHDLAILFNCIGIEAYISKMINILTSNTEEFSISSEDSSIVQNKNKEYEKKLQEIINDAEYFEDESGNKFGIVYSDYEYRNELAEYIVTNGNTEAIKYLIIVAMNKGEFGQKSYRAIEESFDVNEIAMKHGGGGHPGASAVNISKEQKEKALMLNKKEGLKYLANCGQTGRGKMTNFYWSFFPVLFDHLKTF